MTMQDEYDRHLHQEHADDAREAEHRSDAPSTSRGPLPGGEPEKSQGGDGRRNNDPALSRTRRRTLIVASVGLFLVVAGFLGYGVYQRDQRNQAAQQDLNNRQNRIPKLRIDKVKTVDTPKEILSSGDHAGLRCGHDLCPPERLHLSAACRYRKPGQEWRSACHHFSARS